MRRILRTTFALAAFAAPLAAPLTAPLAAQAPNPNCAGVSTATQDACEKATDLFNYMMPQLGTSLVGGSHTLGIGTTLGGLGHFAIALRGNAVRGDVPDLGSINVSPFGRASTNIGTKQKFLGLPAVDFALGIYKGFPLGVTRIGGIDLIGSATYLPEVATDQVTITPEDGALKIGLGARVGLLEQSLVVPGISFSYLVRDLPVVSLAASAGNADFTINQFSVKTTSWRLAAQKNLLLFQLGAGYGQDTYTSAADVNIQITSPAAANLSTGVSQEMTRSTMYGSLGFNLLVAKVVAEVGRVSGGDVSVFNRFAEAADKSRLYGSIGLRISF